MPTSWPFHARLQELLAPQHVVYYEKEWTGQSATELAPVNSHSRYSQGELGNKKSLIYCLSQAAGLKQDVLSGTHETKREHCRANVMGGTTWDDPIGRHSLLPDGLFDVNMPMI